MSTQERAAENDSNIAVLFHQIRSIAESMGELKVMLKTLDDRMRNHEVNEVSYQAVNSGKLDAAHRRIDDNQKCITALDGRVRIIEDKIPLIDDLLKIRTRLIFLVFASGFLGTTFSGLILALLFNYVFGGITQ